MKSITTLLGAALLAFATPASGQERLTLISESYPPFTFRDADGLYRGSSVEQVETTMRHAGIAYSMEIMPWARAITLAETQPMHCVFSAARTAEREQRFKWVTPISVSRALLVRRTGSAVEAKTIEDAKRYTIGTHREDYTENLLKQQGFPLIDLSSAFEISLYKLLEKRVDMIPISENVYDKLKAEGTPLEAVLVIAENRFGIACNKDMPDALITRMQAGLDKLIADKQQDEILVRYGLNPLRLWDK